MKIVRAENAGFCFGVKRAIKLAFEAAANSDKPIHSLGPLIHNPQEVEILSQKGVHVVSDLNSLKAEDTVIIRSHGASPAILKEAQAKKLKVVNATCPFVMKAQKLAQRLSSEGYQVLIIGEGDHPEVIGIMGFAGDDVQVIEKPDDVKNMSINKRSGIVAQTTQSLSNLREVVGELLERCDELRVFNTICDATALRQETALNISREVDLMIVIGGHNSANTTRLASLCRETGVATQHIETADELQASWLDDAGVVGVTAGASTPEWIIEAVIDRLNFLSAV